MTRYTSVRDTRPRRRAGAHELFEEWKQRAFENARRFGIEVGRKQEARVLLERLVRRRFGRLPRGASTRIRQADRATLERWVEQVLTARSAADVFA